MRGCVRQEILHPNRLSGRGDLTKNITLMYAILRITKHSSNGSLGAMTKHNKRELEVPNADPTRLHLNQELIGSGDYIQDVQKRIELSGAMYQKNSVRAIEHLMTASPEFFEPRKKGDTTTMPLRDKLQKFIQQSFNWMAEKYGRENIVSMSLHMDEKTPHLHCFVVPVVDGKLKNGRKIKRLSAKKHLDGRTRLSALQDSYAEAMKNLGLERGQKKSKAHHRTIKSFYSLINSADRFSDHYAVKAPQIEEKPPIMNREAWLEEQNRMIEEQLRQNMEQMNMAMKSNAFLKAKQVKDYYRTGRDIAQAKSEIKAQEDYFENVVKSSKKVENENKLLQQEIQGVKVMNHQLKEITNKAKKQEKLYRTLLRKGLEGKMTPEERDLLLEQIKNLDESQKKGYGRGM